MSVALRLEGSDGVAELLSFDGKVFTMASPDAFAPGAPVRLRATLDGEERPIEGRCLGSRRRDDGRFEVRLRLINLRRADRVALERAVQGP
jgi:hypothetical protein